ncbi:MAG: hypothetical protein V4568_00090 [Pseudomonadota bacterium]
MATKKIKPVWTNHARATARRASELLRDVVLSGEDTFNSLVPFYVAAVCARMDGALNNCFIERLRRKMGASYSPQLRPFLFMKVQDRMEPAPLLLSNFKYKLNDKCDLVKHTHRLFDLRNQFLHAKDLWCYAEVEYGSNGEVLGVDYLVKNHPDPYRNAGKLDLGKLMSVGELKFWQRASYTVLEQCQTPCEEKTSSLQWLTAQR